MARGSIASKSLNEQETGMVFDFADGGEALEAELSEFPQEIVTRLALHGLSQRCGDSYAGVGKEFNDTTEAAAEARRRVERILDQLRQGEYGRVGGGGGGGPRLNLTVKALARATGHTVEEAQQVVEAAKAKDENEGTDMVKRLRQHPEVKQAMEQIKAEEAQAKAEKLREEGGDAPSLDSLFKS